MGFVLLLLLFTIVFVAIALITVRDYELGPAITFGMLALVVLLGLVFFVAPILGYSKVPDKAEEFTKRLEAGKVYRLIATEPVNYENDGEKVLLVSDEELSRRYYAIRVKVSAPIPQRFTLINGVPREVK